MTISKDTFDAYRITNNGEWASIALRTWSRPINDGKETYYCGEILIRSSFGNFNNCWTACGVPFKEFLLDVDWDYFMQKCGCTTHVYDGPATLRHIQREILRQRRDHDFDARQARDLWDAVCDADTEIIDGLNQMVLAMQGAETEVVPDREVIEFLAEPRYFQITKPNPQATGFWRELWPEFVAELRRELSAEVPA